MDQETKYAEMKQKRNRIVDAVLFGGMLAAASAFTLALFYRQAMGEIPSDMKAYILEMQGLDSGYRFPYPVFFRFAAFLHFFCSPELAVALAVMLLNGLALVVAKLTLNGLALPVLKAGGREIFWRIVLSLLSAALFFISMLYPPEGIYLPGIRFRYLGVFTANPFHNATYMAARPFAMLAFLWYVKLLPLYEKNSGEKRDYILFSLFLLLATMTKPSFTLVMVSTSGLMLLYRLFRARFRNLMPTIRLGLSFLPTFLALLYQYRGVFVPDAGEEGGVGFCVGEVWAEYCGCIPLAVCLAVGFPLLVLVCNLREGRMHTLYRFSWLVYLISFLEAFFLYEKGFRKPDFNFSWGYMYGIFFCHFGALILLLQVTGRTLRRKPAVVADGGGGTDGAEHADALHVWGQKALLVLQWAAFLWHVTCGVLYFKDCLEGIMYY